MAYSLFDWILETMLRRENKKTSISPICLDVKPVHVVGVTTKSYQVGYITLQFPKFDGRRGNTRKHVVQFLDFIGGHPNEADLSIREFLRSLKGQAYT